MAFSWRSLFGKDSPGQQLLVWNVGAEFITALASPGLALLTQEINKIAQTTPLSPPDLAQLVIRSYLGQGEAAEVAKRSGVSPGDFNLMLKIAGDALDTTSLIEAYRRQKIPWDSGNPDVPGVLQGIEQGRLDPKWAPVIKALGQIRPGVADAVDAAVEGQASYEDMAQLAAENGVDADDFRLLFNTRGNPPDPTQLAELVHRGSIPLEGTGPDVLSFVQGISEGATKDKWIPALKDLMVKLPAEAQIRTLLSTGALDDATAASYWTKLGYDPAIIAGFIKDAHRTRTATDHALSKADILKLYADRAVDAATATQMLAADNYPAAVAGEMLAIQDQHLAVSTYDAALSRIRGYYIARKIDDSAVVAALDSLGVPTAQRDQVLTTWRIERDSNTRVLTEAQIVDAWFYQLIDQATATTMLQATGLTSFEAWIVLSIKAKGPIGPAPADQPNPLGP